MEKQSFISFVLHIRVHLLQGRLVKGVLMFKIQKRPKTFVCFFKFFLIFQNSEFCSKFLHLIFSQRFIKITSHYTFIPMINLLKCVVLQDNFSKEKPTWEGVFYNIVKKQIIFLFNKKKVQNHHPRQIFHLEPEN